MPCRRGSRQAFALVVLATAVWATYGAADLGEAFRAPLDTQQLTRADVQQ